jgi:putative transposase
VSALCGAFGFTRQAYYKLLKSKSKEKETNKKVLEMVQLTRKRIPCSGTVKVYGKIKPKLNREAIKMGREKLNKLLREERMLVRPKKRFTRTTDSNHRFKKWPNLIKEMKINAPEQVWVSDITYISTRKGFMYLFLVTDVYSKQIMGYHLGDSLKVENAHKALKQAMSNRRYPDRELIHHSDRGLQYSHPSYIKLEQDNGIKPSMTTKYDPYENAVAERVNGILKSEFDVGGIFPSAEMANREVKTAIQIYNYERPHMSCQMMTPWEAHRHGKYELKKWKKRILSPVMTGDKN